MRITINNKDVERIKELRADVQRLRYENKHAGADRAWQELANIAASLIIRKL